MVYDDIAKQMQEMMDRARSSIDDMQAKNDRWDGLRSDERLKWVLAKIHRTIEEPFPDMALPYLIRVPCVMIIVGGRGTGKTAQGCSLLEAFRDHQWGKYVVGIPKAAQRNFPTWITAVPTLWDLPSGAIALVDEAHFKYGMRMSEQDRRELMELLSLARQKKQLLIFVSQQTRTLSREIVAAADVLIIKRMLPHQIKFERPEFEEALLVAQEKLRKAGADRQKLTYVYAPDDEIEMMMTGELPSFWTETLSNMFAEGSGPRSLRDEAAVRRREAIALAKRLRADEWTYGMIRRRLGVSKTTAWNYVKRY